MGVLRGLFEMAKAKFIAYKLGRAGWLRTIRYVPSNLPKEERKFLQYELY